MSKIIKIENDMIYFDDGYRLYSSHEQDCCEHHYLDVSYVKIEEVKDLEFDLEGESFFERVDSYGIRLLPLNGHPISIPGYGSNNGYYSSNLTLVLDNNDKKCRTYDITECQENNY